MTGENLFIQDVTLRDGMHALRHRITPDRVRAVVNALDAAGVDAIEVAHGDGLAGGSVNYGPGSNTDWEWIEAAADSINSAILGPDAAPGTEIFDLFVKEVVREMTLKAGQKCTAIRRVLVPRQQFHAVGEAISAKLNSAKVGNPRNAEVKVGPVVNKTQQAEGFPLSLN